MVSSDLPCINQGDIITQSVGHPLYRLDVCRLMNIDYFYWFPDNCLVKQRSFNALGLLKETVVSKES